MIKSGTDEVRGIIAPYLKGLCGVDLGYGGDSISPNAINIDQVRPYTRVGDDPQHLAGDACRLHWFADGVLDYVYSSHLLEDFPNTAEIVREWARVIRKGGWLILYLPDEFTYRNWCRDRKQRRNLHHTIDNMSIEYMLPIVTECGLKTVAARNYGLFSFLIIAEKI